MTEPSVRYSIEGRLARVHLDRASEGNRITSVTMAGLVSALSSAAESSADVLVISASGDDFCLGRDQNEALPADVTRAENVRRIVQANRALSTFGGISISVVQGRALGFGSGLVIQSDLAVAADTASFGFDEIHYGRAPRFVMAYLADFIGPKRALDLIVTGRPISAAEAERFGMISRVVPPEDLRDAAESLAADLLKLDPTALRSCKSYPREIRRIDPAERDEYAYAQTVGPQKGHDVQS